MTPINPLLEKKQASVMKSVLCWWIRFRFFFFRTIGLVIAYQSFVLSFSRVPSLFCRFYRFVPGNTPFIPSHRCLQIFCLYICSSSTSLSTHSPFLPFLLPLLSPLFSSPFPRPSASHPFLNPRVYNRSESYCINNNIFPPSQFGFQKVKSTKTALVSFIESLFTSFD